MSRTEKSLVIGFGVSGRAAARFLLSKGSKVVVADQRPLQKDPEAEFFLQRGVEFALDTADLSLEGVSLAILSPGVPPENPLVQKVLANGIETIGEIELALRHIGNPCIGITGTNGKTTTVLLIEHLLSQAGIRAKALGNVGDPLSRYLLDPNPEEILILELSSFQLETVQAKRLDVAMILNITPNHLNRHSSMQEYADAKLKIQKCLKPGGAFWVSRQLKGEFRTGGQIYDPSPEYAPWETDEKVAPISPFRYIELGKPERQNIQAAHALCAPFGLTKTQFCQGLETFRKPAHRIEWVAEIEGVSYFNDSKASNISAVMHAMSQFPGPVILLAGGMDKGASYAPWIGSFRKKVKMIIAFGQAAEKMESELSGAFELRRADTMSQAVEWAAKCAERGSQVLLSPGCSSYDQFRNYEHRGDEFKRLVRGLV